MVSHETMESRLSGQLGKAFDAGGGDTNADLSKMDVSGIEVVAGGKPFPDATPEEATDAIRAIVQGGGEAIRGIAVIRGVETAPPAGHEDYMTPEQRADIIKHGTGIDAPGVTSYFG